MNSYPVHFLAHHRPLLFVAGLDPPTPTAAPPSTAPDASTSEPQDASASSPSPVQPKRRPSEVVSDDPFVMLAHRLRSTLTAKGQSTVWESQTNDKKKDFHVVLVDKDVRLPPAKATPPPPSSSTTSSASGSNPTPRSPLSPYTPGSPLFPDGLIAPIWVRKHTSVPSVSRASELTVLDLTACFALVWSSSSDLLPAVFVLFLRLSEEEDTETNKLRDDELVKELLGRKKVLADRGIKLTVVLIASRELLDDPSLDPRLSQIRRQSSLDSRASLFVLTPVTPAELHDFVRSLQDVLYEPALEYYQQHSKRVRRKRARLGPGASSGGGGGGVTAGGTAGRELGREGWIVRYEYKAGCFAEIRGEMDVARKHYEECWVELSLLFHSTSTLPPRTKRWAEAKVLADCVAIKVCKLYFYQNDTPRALAFFRRHLKKFEELSRGWGIGEETFEFWSWVARQYRIFAELLEMGVAAGLVLPTPSAPRAPPAVGQPAQDFLDPALVLQHPGFYYEAAACCSVRRKETFQAALEAETDAQSSEAGSASGYVSTSPGFANEKKVDHSALIVELFTKSYELLKKTSGSSRVTLYIAFRIAEAYHDGGQYDMALRFFDRISKTYRRERWDPISERIRELWLDCARREGKHEDAVRMLLEMITLGSSSLKRDTQAELLALLKETKPSSTQPLVFRSAELSPLLACSSSFWLESAVTGQGVPYQVTLASRSKAGPLDALPFESVRLEFSDGRPSITVTHDASLEETSNLRLVQLDGDDSKASLRWQKDAMAVFSGVLTSDSANEIKVTSVTAVISEGDWKIELLFDPNASDQPSRFSGRWLTRPSSDSFTSLGRPEPGVTRVTEKPHVLDIVITDASPAYMEEQFPISVQIRNDDTRALDVWIDVLLYPTEDQSETTITVDGSSSTSILKQISLGTLEPSSSSTKTILLLAKGSQEGERIIDVSVQSRLHVLSSSSSPTPATATSSQESDVTTRPTETIRTLTIPVVRPIAVGFSVQRFPPREPVRELLDPESFEEDGAFEKEGEVLLTSRFELVGGWDVEVEGVVFHVGETRHARGTFSSLDAGSPVPKLWKSGDSFAIVSSFDVASAETATDAEDDDRPLSTLRQQHHASPGWFDIAWRRASQTRSASEQPLSHAIIPLPFLAAPPQTPTTDSLLATLSISSSSPPRLLQPFTVTLTVHNLSPLDLAASLQLSIESSDAFAWAGPRQMRLPLLLAGQSRVVTMRVVGLRAGWSRLPRVRMWELVEPEEGGMSGEVVSREVRVGKESGQGEEDEDGGMRVFVLPG